MSLSIGVVVFCGVFFFLLSAFDNMKYSLALKTSGDHDVFFILENVIVLGFFFFKYKADLKEIKNSIQKFIEGEVLTELLNFQNKK